MFIVHYILSGTESADKKWVYIFVCNRSDNMSNFSDTVLKAAGTSTVCGSTGAAIGGSVVAAVCAVGGTVFGPAGTFFGAAVGTEVGAAVGGAIGSVGGFIGSVIADSKKKWVIFNLMPSIKQ